MKLIRLSATLLMVALCFNFVSCGKDEEGSNPEKQTKRLTSISYIREDGYKDALQIEYVNGKVAKTTWKFYADYSGTSTETYAYTYSGNTVKELNTYISRDGDSESNTTTYTLNDNGYATKDDNGYEFEYSDKFLISAIDEADIEMGDKGGNTKYTFNGEGLKTSSTDYDNIEYTDISNIGNLFLTYSDDEPLSSIDFATFYTGILGNAAKRLPKEAQSGDYRETYSYELDDDGYVKSCVITQYYEGGKSVHTWKGTLTYEPYE